MLASALTRFLPLCTFLLLNLTQAQAQTTSLLTEKSRFELASYTTVGGQEIKPVVVGYETYGQLNAEKNNVIFIAHFYSGTSHAAGKYASNDAAAGYWDSIIGPSKAIDTNRFFVISADTLVNLHAKDPKVITTGPASIDPATGKAYGLRFPVVSMRDSVQVHKALLDKLGIKKLVAVMGASGGSIQAMEWAVNYPDLVERVIAVISPGLSISPWGIAQLDAWATPIRLDPKWNRGDYYGKDEPAEGVAAGLKLVTLSARHWLWADTYGYASATPNAAPSAALDQHFSIEDGLNKIGVARARTVDANHMLYMSKANQLFNIEDRAQQIKAKVLFIPAHSDVLFPPEFSQRAAAKLRGLGKSAEVYELPGNGGHLDGVLAISPAADKIREFLTK